MRTSPIWSIFLVVASLLFLPGTATPVFAATGNSTPIGTPPPTPSPVFSAGPAYAQTGYYTYDVTPGQTLSNTLKVVNMGTAAGSATLYASDGITGSTSGVVYALPTVPKADEANWIHLEMSSVDLKAQTSAMVRFTVTVPPDAAPGDHIAGLVVQDDTLSTSGSGVIVIKVQKLVIIAVLLHVQVPGQQGVHAMKITGVTPDGHSGVQYLDVQLQDTGNFLEKLKGIVQIRDASGALYDSADVSTDSFVPRTGDPYPVSLPTIFAPGNYRVHIDLVYNQTQHVTYDTSFTVSDKQVKSVYAGVPTSQIPLAIQRLGSGPSTLQIVLTIGGVILFLIVLLLLFFFWKRKKRQDDQSR